VKFDLASDVHADHWRKRNDFDWSNAKNPDSTVLVLAGDIGNYTQDIFRILNQTSKLYEHIVLVDGNHEHYFSYKLVEDLLDDLEKETKRAYKNVTLLRGNNNLVLGNTIFLGANAWYDWRIMEPDYSYSVAKTAWLRYMNDSRYIMFGKEQSADDWAKKQSNQIKEQVISLQDDDTIDNIVVVTHTAPLRELLIVKTDDDVWNQLTGSFGNSKMAEVIAADNKKKIKSWCYGHTHQRNDKVIGDIRYINNARGYPSENKDETWALKQVEI